MNALPVAETLFGRDVRGSRRATRIAGYRDRLAEVALLSAHEAEVPGPTLSVFIERYVSQPKPVGAGRFEDRRSLWAQLKAWTAGSARRR